MDQKSVAVYYGKSEAGPRALGHRSILFDARNPNAKDLVNRVKNREWYRPFAAICLREDAEKYFELNDYENSKFMTVNFDAKSIAKEEIPGVLHVDNTSRIQLIEDESEPCHQLLVELKKRTGVGVLLNTSFNLAGKPLVETPEDAIWTLNNSPLDAVWFPSIETIQV
jgi:carbamoyltransferase